MARFGFPSGLPIPRSKTAVSVVEPVLGLTVDQPSTDAELGSTPDSDNFIMREGGLEPRPCLSLRNTNAQPFTARVLGGTEVIDVTGGRYPLVSTTSRMAWHSGGSWSVLSYVSSYGISDPPAGATTDYWDFAQIYYDQRDENIAVGAIGSYQSLYCWQSNTTVFSSLTGAPRAKYVVPFDNYLLALNVRSNNSDYVQRIQWCDRGSASSWTGGLSGFEDLLDAKGQITRGIRLENRVIVFFEGEIWQGFPVDFPFIFRFQPLDRSVGCPYPWTVAETPRGPVFLGKDYQVYLLPKEGGPAVPIGQRLHRTVRSVLDQPQRSFGVYDSTYGQYQFYYPVKGGSGLPQRGVFLNIAEGSWAPQSFDRSGGNISLTRGFEAQLSSSATTWGGLQAAGIRWADMNQSWAELAGASEERAVHLGTSGGTMMYLNSAATSDNGTAVPCYWQSTALLGERPGNQKTVTEVRIDYRADSASSVTLKMSANQGASFDAGLPLTLPTTSALSQAVAYPYAASRYPMLRVESEGHRYRLFRFHVTMREGGR